MIAAMSPRSDIALMAAVALPELGEDGAVPEWIHLLPRSGEVACYDGRSYRYADGAALIAASMGYKPRMPVDENHSTDIAAPKGLPSPARGQIVEMHERPDGIWAKVAWNRAGEALLADRAYWGISPVFQHDRKGRIVRVLRAALTNNPNLRGLTALNSQEEDAMTFKERLAETLGLEKDAGEDAILAAVEARDAGAALQAQISEIGVALGLDEGAAAEDVLKAAQAAQVADAGGEETITALQSELAEVTTQLNGLQEARRREQAETFVDGAIRERRAGGLTAKRESWIAAHMQDPAGTEDKIRAMPILGPSGTAIEAPKPKDGAVALNAEQSQILRSMGVDRKKVIATLEAERGSEEAL